MEFMIGHKPNIFWQATWRVISPLIVLVIFVFYFVTKVSGTLTYITWNPSSVCFSHVVVKVSPPSLKKICIIWKKFFFVSQENFPVLETLEYPSWINVIIFLLAGLPGLFIPGYALCKLLKRCCCKKERNKRELNTVSANVNM